MIDNAFLKFFIFLGKRANPNLYPPHEKYFDKPVVIMVPSG